VSDIFSLWPSLRALTGSYALNMEAPSDWEGRGGSALVNKRAVLLTIPEVATALRISRSSVYRLFEGGELRWVRVGSTRRVSSAEINRFIAEHTEAAS
jgi:excisionase family DNA binding protein